MADIKDKFLKNEVGLFLIKRFIYNERLEDADSLIDELFTAITEKRELNKQQKSNINHFREMIISEIKLITEYIFSEIRFELELFRKKNDNFEMKDIKYDLDRSIVTAMVKKRITISPAYIDSLSDIALLYFYRMNDEKIDDFFICTCSTLMAMVITEPLIKEYDDYVISFLISENKKNSLANPQNIQRASSKKKRTPNPHKIEVIKIIDNTLRTYPKTSTYSIVNLLCKHFKDGKSRSSYARWVAERRIATGITVEKSEICKDKIKLIFELIL
ncbi:hypothetical protein QCI94_002942 [Salmonella enterica]|nr:hypothetical protein [Salmonella enterica]EKS7253806.1 hypothetical protein [Salmonella enterica]EKS7272312.1 hypothetical protein [Salmonella enterica]EKS7281780.1 hypothetical protein [Salmonella enterica]